LSISSATVRSGCITNRPQPASPAGAFHFSNAHPSPLPSSGDELELSVTEAAKALGVTRQQLYNVIAGRNAVTGNGGAVRKAFADGRLGSYCKLVSYDSKNFFATSRTLINKVS
jgi:hypothetical protein